MYGMRVGYRPSRSFRYRPYGYRRRRAVRGGRRLGRPISGTRRSRPTIGKGVTNQYDVKTIYVKKRMPRGKRRAWVKKIRQVTAIQLKNTGTKTIVRNSTVSEPFTGNGQKFYAVHLYGKNGVPGAFVNRETATNDLGTIFANDPTTVNGTAKAFFGSGVLDMTFHNNGSTKLEVDLYVIYHGTQRNDYENFHAAEAQATGVTPLISGFGSSLSLNLRGTTPFDLPALIKQGMKIYMKKKYFLDIGEVGTFQYRDPKNRVFSTQNIVRSITTPSYVYDGVTKTFLFIWKNVSGSNEEAENSLSVGVTRKYMYKTIEDNDDADQVV